MIKLSDRMRRVMSERALDEARRDNPGIVIHSAVATTQSYVDRVRAPLFREVVMCRAGKPMRRCDDCAEFVCDAFGHAAHVCRPAAAPGKVLP